MVSILIASSTSKKGLEKLINKYFYSDFYKILNDNSLFNPTHSKEKNNEINQKFCVVEKKGRWRFEYREV